MSHSDTFKTRAGQINDALSKYFSDPEAPEAALFEAMRYSLLAPGKRIRPVLTLELCAACGGGDERALPLACAVEMVHTYSLIHDDLPCMDNDDYRRGRLTSHKMFGEAMAVLAGDALLTAAFGAALKTPDAVSARAAKILAEAAGESGMVAGQTLDLAAEGRAVGTDMLFAISRRKTAALLRAACQMGVAAANGTEEQLRLAGEYAENIGLAFQITDDLLDMTGDAESLGKPTGSDAANGKTTFAALLGQAECERLTNQYTARAVAAARELCGNDSFAEWLALTLAKRTK